MITKVMSEITINELEAAINFWRARSPSEGDELVLCKEASALSKPYALMIVQRRRRAAFCVNRRLFWTIVGRYGFASRNGFAYHSPSYFFTDENVLQRVPQVRLRVALSACLAGRVARISGDSIPVEAPMR
jgi:hypothetical protein